MINLIINGVHYIEKNGVIYADGERWGDAGLFKYLLNAGVLRQARSFYYLNYFYLNGKIFLFNYLQT